MAHYSAAYVEHLKKGPFPGHVDPWAEAAHYFHPLHGSMISALLSQLNSELLPRGYFASREASLQIAERTQPDVMIRNIGESTQPKSSWNYIEAAEAVIVDPGIMPATSLPELEAIYIRNIGAGDLITILEVVSPGNKDSLNDIWAYGQRRDRIVRDERVNFVEIDPTRSVKRLLRDVGVASFAYHIAIYMPDNIPLFVGVKYGQPLKEFALPLRNEVVPVETQAAYDAAYQEVSTPIHIDQDGGYHESDLPFPSLLTAEQRAEALRAVDTWSKELERLRGESA